MRLPERLRLDNEQRRLLVSVAGGDARPDVVLRGGRIVNVYTRRIEEGSVGIAGGRIAWVGQERGPDPVRLIELDGAFIAPGLIEPHAHADVICTPSEFGRAVARHGTTSVCADTVYLALRLDDDDLVSLLEALAQEPVKFFWNLGNNLDGTLPDEVQHLTAERLKRLLERVPGVVASAEMAAWPRLLAGDDRLGAIVERVVDDGLRVDGHAPGASRMTLTRLAAAGVTADHESITAEELSRRLALGLWAMLRDSSLRPDGREIAAGLVALDLPLSRVMLTADGPVPGALVEGHLDRVVRRVVEGGLDPIDAVTAATLNPATYLGLDGHLGGVAPGRCADLLVVDSLDRFEIRTVITDGVVLGEDGSGTVDWNPFVNRRHFTAATLTPSALTEICAAGPHMRLEGIITRSGLPSSPGCHAALVDREGRWLVGSTIEGIETQGAASSYTGSGDVLVLGTDPAAAVRAYQRVVDLGGGMVVGDQALPLPVLGAMSDRPVGELADRLASLQEGVAQRDGSVPLPYLSLFLSLSALPDLRLTPRGVVDVRRETVVGTPVALPS